MLPASSFTRYRAAGDRCHAGHTETKYIGEVHKITAVEELLYGLLIFDNSNTGVAGARPTVGGGIICGRGKLSTQN